MAHAANSATEITWQFTKLTYLKGFREILRAPGRLYELHKKRLLTTSHPSTKNQNPVSALTFPPQPGSALAHGPGAHRPASGPPNSKGDEKAGTGGRPREVPSPRGARPARQGRFWAARARRSRRSRPRRTQPQPQTRPLTRAGKRRRSHCAGAGRGRDGGGAPTPLPRPGRGSRGGATGMGAGRGGGSARRGRWGRAGSGSR